MSQQAIEPLNAQDDNWTGNKTIEALSGNITDPKTDTSPAVASFNGYLVFAFKNSGSEDLYQSIRSPNGKWSSAPVVAGSLQIKLTTSAAPSLAVFNDRLYMAYLSAAKSDGEYIINIATLASDFAGGNKWENFPEITIDDQFLVSEYSPSLAVLGTGNSARLWLGWQKHGGELRTATTSNGTDWAGNKKIQTASKTPQSNYGPALCGYNDAMWVIFKEESGNNLRYVTYDVATGVWNGDADIEIEGEDKPESNRPPGIAVFDGSMYIAYKGKSSNDIRQALLTGDTWTGNVKINVSGISPATDATPSMTTAVQDDGEVLILANKGSSSSDEGVQIYVSELR